MKIFSRRRVLMFAFTTLAALADLAGAQQPVYQWTTVAGQPGGVGSADGTGPAARFFGPRGTAVDGAGNVYVADTNNNTIRKITSAGVVTTLAGVAGGVGSQDGTGAAARFSRPSGVAVDSSGNVYVADTGNYCIRKITPVGMVTTFAGSPPVPRTDSGPGDADGMGTAARFRSPVNLAFDLSGNLYVIDDMADTVRKVTSAGLVTTVAGKPDSRGENGVSLVDGQGAAARFFGPSGIAADAAGNVYVADSQNAALRKVTPGGAVTTLVQNPTSGPPVLPYGVLSVTVASGGQISIGDGFSVRKVSAAGVVTLLAGGSGSPSSNDGTGSAAGFYLAQGFAADASGNLFVADELNNTIRKVTPAGVVTTFAGSAGQFGSTDATGRAARFYQPTGITVDAAGNVYVADQLNQTIRKGTSAGVFTTLAGGVGRGGYLDATGSAARFSNPYGVAVDAAGNVYVTDLDNDSVRKVTPAGVVTTLAGAPQPDTGDGGAPPRPTPPAGTFAFDTLRGVAVDGSGNVFVSDEAGPIYKITSAGVVTTLANEGGFAVNPGSEALFNRPLSLSLDANGNLFVAELYNYVVRKITPAGVISTVAGNPGVSGSIDGTGGAAQFSFPLAVAADRSGNVFVGDGSTIRKIAPGGVVTTIGGKANEFSVADGVGTTARFTQITGITVAADGTIYAVDPASNRIIRGVPMTAPAAPVYGRNPAIYVVEQHGASIVPNLPIPVSAQAAPTSFAITPALPPGLSFNSTTGAITGAPFGGGSSTQPYTVTASNAAGTSPATVLTLGIGPSVSGWVWADFAGTAQAAGSADGTGPAARFNVPVSAAVDGQGNIYTTDFAGHTVRKITPDRVVTTLAGKAGASGSADGVGSAARFNNPAGVAADARGNVYVGDSGNSTIRKISPSGLVTTLAGLAGNAGSADGAGGAARFRSPKGIAVDAAGNVYVGDLLNHTIRKISPAGVVSTLAGSPGLSGLVNGTGSAARFNGPTGLAVDASGDLYVADTRNSVIRKVTSAGVVTTVTGRTESALPVSFDRPQDVTVDATGNLYVADTSASGIRRITRDGEVTTVGGSLGSPGYRNGTDSRFSTPYGIVVNNANRLLVADTGNQRIAKGAENPRMAETYGPNSQTLVFAAGQAITTLRLRGADDRPIHYTISPPLPAGLYLDPVTGDISGTPIESAAGAHYLVTGTYSDSYFATGLFITINAGSAALPGSYSLVLGNPGGPRGALSLTLSPGLIATGTLVRENGTRLVVQTGALASDRTTSLTLSDGSTLSLAFSGVGRLSATLAAGGTTLSGVGSIAPPSVPAGLAGTYTVVFDTGAGGYGFALLTLTNKCGLIVGGRLPDGSAFLGNQDLLLDRDGNVAVFFLGDGTPRSLLAGDLHFGNGSVSDNGVSLKLTTAAATVACDALGFMYTPTSSGLAPGNYPLTLSGAGVSIISTTGFDSFNHVSVAPPVLGLQSSTFSGLANGLFSLQFRALNGSGQPTGPTLTGSGVYDQRKGQGFGQFTKDGQTGSVVIGPIAP